MATWDERTDEAPLDERVVDYLSERSGHVAFNGLRRALSAHPESLTRSLRRLERHGVVRRDSDGYRLSEPRPGPSETRPRTLRPFAEVTLAPGISESELFGRLAGRWFGPLRWVGMYEPADGPWLVWSVESTHGQVRLGIRRGRLKVALDVTAEEDPEGRVESAARSLLRHALDAMTPTAAGVPGGLALGATRSLVGLAG